MSKINWDWLVSAISSLFSLFAAILQHSVTGPGGERPTVIN